MGSSVIGALRVTLGLDTAAFTKGLDLTQRQLAATGKSFNTIGKQMTDLGSSLALKVTAPIALAGGAIVKMAGDFQAAMIQVGINADATGKQLQSMNDLALELGKSTVFSASEAAGAMNELAKNGVTAKDILGGAAAAAVNLAAATGSELEPAATAVTNAMQQFGMSTKDLPNAVNLITGAVNQSTLDFKDFQEAASQSGGVAAALGVSFKDFNSILAGTSYMFHGGSDEGTSFKNFLLALNPKTKQAAEIMQQLGVSLYDATGKLKPMADVAQILQDRFGKLSEQQQSHDLGKIFGTDAIRPAIALIKLGADGLNKVADGIAKTDAAAQSAKRMSGFNGQLEQLRGSLETLAIKIGQSGVLDALTSLVTGLGDFVDKLSDLSPATLKWAAIFATVAAAIGPVLIVMGTLTSAVGTLLGALAPLAAEGGLLAGLPALLNPIGLTVAALAAAWVLFGAQIGPVLSDLWNKASTVLGPPLQGLITNISAALTALWSGPFGTMIKGAVAIVGELLAILLRAFGTEIISALNVFVTLLSAAFKAIGDAIRVVNDLVHGDFTGAWREAKAIVTDLLKGIVDAAKIYLQDKLGGIFGWVKAAISDVGDAFYKLWDRVVGHSYVPDLVDGIADNFARLDAVMVKPALAGTDKVAQAFNDLQGKVGGIMNQLFPGRAGEEQAAANAEILKKAAAAGIIDKGLLPEALKRNEEQGHQGAYGQMTDSSSAAQKSVDDMVASFDKMPVDDVAAKLSAMLDAAKGKVTSLGSALNGVGDTINHGIADALDSASNGFKGLGSIALNVLNQIGQQIINNLTTPLSQIGGSGGIGGAIVSGISKLFGGGTSLSSLSSPSLGLSSTASSLAMPNYDFSSSIPAFDTGGSFTVGGMPGKDRNLFSMRLTKGEMVNISHGEANDNPRSGAVINQSVNVQGGVDLATRTETYRLAEATRQAAIGGVQEWLRRKP